jgi:hypothetical protein
MLEIGIGVGGLVLSVVLFFVGERRGRRSMQESVRHALTVASHLPASRHGPQGILPAIEYPAAIGYAETTNDGNRQVLMMYGTVAHATALRVFGRVGGPGGEVVEIGHLLTGTGAAFQVGDFDDDGYAEVATLVYDWDAIGDRALVDAPLRPVYWRWDGSLFPEVGHGKTWDPRAKGPVPDDIAPFLRVPNWAITLPSGD